MSSQKPKSKRGEKTLSRRRAQSKGTTSKPLLFFLFSLESAASLASGDSHHHHRAGLTFVETLALKEAQQRLDALQRDTFKVDAAEIAVVSEAGASRKRPLPSEHDDDNNDNDDDDDAGAVGKRRRGRVHLRTVRSLQQLVEEAGIDAYPSHVPTCLTAAAAPSALPRRSFCLTCGYLARYTCTRCSQKYCSLSCNQAHVEAKRCR